jgi:AcrR family transcriptional regulator
MRSRNETQKAKRREVMLDAAQKVFFRQGFEQTTMDDIANETGFSRGLLYVYFADKKGIYDAIRVRATQTLHDRMRRYTDEQTRGIDKIKACGLAFYHFYRDDRLFYDCLSHNMSMNNQNSAALISERSDAVKIAEKQVMNIMLDAIRTGWSDASIRTSLSNDPLELALYMRGSLHGIIMLQSELGSAMLENATFNREQFIESGLERMTLLLATQTRPEVLP